MTVRTMYNLRAGLVQQAADEARIYSLTGINNLIGNVVIFVQPSEPSDSQIKARFADVEPLSDSTCGG